MTLFAVLLFMSLSGALLGLGGFLAAKFPPGSLGIKRLDPWLDSPLGWMLLLVCGYLFVQYGGVAMGASYTVRGNVIYANWQADVAKLAVITAVLVGCLWQASRLWAGLLALYTAMTTVAWVLWPSWLTSDLLTVPVVLAPMLLLARLSVSVGVAGAFLFGATASDVWHTLFTSAMDATARVYMSASMMSPFALIAPHSLSLHATASGLQGTADVYLPGWLVMIAAMLQRTHQQEGIVGTVIVGYLLGMVIDTEVVLIFHAGQPALLYVFPSTLIALLWAAKRRGLLGKLLQLPPRTA